VLQFRRMDKAGNRPFAGDVQDLAVAVEQLTEEARFLRMSLDELRDDVVWAARQVLAAGHDVSGTATPAHRDPLAPDMASDAKSPSLEHAMDRDAETADAGPYCCKRPKLEWNGDPDSPGVACANCGYVIAENGSVVILRDEPDEVGAAAAAGEFVLIDPIGPIYERSGVRITHFMFRRSKPAVPHDARPCAEQFLLQDARDCWEPDAGSQRLRTGYAAWFA
jgi:hypothetical protein